MTKTIDPIDHADDRSARGIRQCHRILDLLTKEQRRAAAGLLGMMAVGTIVEALSVWITSIAIILLARQSLDGAPAWLRSSLDLAGYLSPNRVVVAGLILLVGTYLTKAVYLALLAYLQTSFAFRVQAALSQRLFALYMRQPYAFHLQQNSAHLVRNVEYTVSDFAINGLQAGLTLVSECMVLLAIGTLLLTIEPAATLCVAATIVTAAWSFSQMTRARVVRAGEIRQYHDGMRLQIMQEGLSSAKEVKLLGRESDLVAQFGNHCEKSTRAASLASTLQQMPRLWLELLAVCAIAGLAIGIMETGRAPGSVLPAIGLFAAAAFRLMPSMSRVINARQALHYGLAAIKTLHHELGRAIPADALQPAVHRAFKTKLALKNLSFKYPNATSPVLSELSLTIHSGECIGLVGETGAGKSTLVDILLGLLPPDSGTVCMDGRDVREALRDWQSQIGYVPQSIFLSDDSLLRNVAFGLPTSEINMSAVRRSIASAQLDEFVASLPAGLSTIAGERGVRISGGQRQRIAIARALYHDPALIVFDEATSSLDDDTEQGVLQAVRQLRGLKTILIVSHRMSAVAYCDRIYRLHAGRVEAIASSRSMS